jgi:hypothetical protein
MSDTLKTAFKLREDAAQRIYETWAAAPGYAPWVVGGNSWRQDDARRVADKIVAPLIAEHARREAAFAEARAAGYLPQSAPGDG